MSESICNATAIELLGAHPAQVPDGARIDAIDVGRRVSGRQLLQNMSLSVEPGELVAIAGGSGAGKTTLLEILAGLRPPSAGELRHDGVVPRTRAGAGAGPMVGYVPQDDIIHLEMPLRRTLRYAALLRLPAGTPAVEAERIVNETMQDLDLADRADVPVRALSGGQRKRASIAVELLTRPRVFFLDEPTSGLDPSTAADVMRLLRRLSQRGVTVVLTTHEPAGIDQCDRVIFLARDGHLAFTGTPVAARRYFGVQNLTEVYERLAQEHTPRIWADRFADSREKPPTRPDVTRKAMSAKRYDVNRTGMVRQWWLLTRRNVDVLFRNRLTLAILLGSPVLVTAMMATLFKRGAFDPGDAAGVGPAQIVFWIAFDGFFYGLTYGLLQIVGEMAVFRRERLAGLRVGAYVASKVAALLPVLAGVSAVLLVVLRALGRLPDLGWHVYALLFATIVIEAISALALGLFASAAVSNAAQAALALPMLCFPQVLFGGAIVPVDQMATPGRLMSMVLSNRHAFDALGRDLQLDRYTTTLPAMSAYRQTFQGGNAVSLITLASFAIALTLATAWLLDRRSRPCAS